MQYLFFLFGENIALAFSELNALLEVFGIKAKVRLLDNLAFVEADVMSQKIVELCERSSLIRNASEVISEFKKFKLDDLKELNWADIVDGSFCVRIKNNQSDFKLPEAKLAGPIWNALKKPKVNLDNPNTTIEFWPSKSAIIVSKLIWEYKPNKYSGREPKDRPAKTPVALKPKLARLLINLSRAKENEKLLDPFCGAGAIVAEAAVIGCKAMGSDFDKEMIARSKTNLNYLNLRYQVYLYDATKLSKKFKNIDAVATDPPYGKSTKVGAKNILDLYNKFLRESHKILKKDGYVAFIYPKKVKLEIDKKKWQIVDSAEMFVHGGLTRKVIAVKRL